MKVQKVNSDSNVTQMIEMYERQLYDLKQLIEICKGLNSTLIDYNRLIDSILLTCMGQMQLTKAGIFLKKSIDEDVFVLHRNYKGFDLDHKTEYSIKGGSSLIEFLDVYYQCYDLHELVEKVDDSPELDTLKHISPNLIIPLKGKDKLNGIIVLGDRIKGDFFLESEKDYLMQIASLCGVAIHNAYLYEMATTDMMTKLKLHHFFQTSLIEAREKAVRENGNLSLIMMDIDHFKEFNDKYGHICGDMIMRHVGRMVLEKIRRMDIASRYGGEEFAIILPEADLDEAFLIAERIRESIANMVVEYDGRKMSITVSLGVTPFSPVEDIDNHIIIERADKALYMSKDKGRNRTTAYQ